MRQVERQQRQVEPEWEKTEWPGEFNKMACQFFLVGEVLLQLVEQPALVDLARRLLDCQEVHIGACGIGDASRIVSADGRPQRQVHWHADGAPEVKQVSLRTALDRHEADNGPLRILPGSHLRPNEEMREEFLQVELATGQHDTHPALFLRPIRMRWK